MRRLLSSISTRLKLEGRPARRRLEIVPAVETTRPGAPSSTVCTASWWSWPQRTSSVPKDTKALRACFVLERPWRPEVSPLMGLWWIMTTLAASGVACENASSTFRRSRWLTCPITPRSLMRRVKEPREMPCAVLHPAITAPGVPGISSDGLSSGEMYRVYLEYLNSWAVFLQTSRLRATAPTQRTSWLPGMTMTGAVSRISSR